MEGKKPAQSKTIGVIFILLASVIWAVEPALAKLSYQAQGNFLQTTAYRAIVVSAVGLVYALVTNKANLKLKPREFGVAVYIAMAASVFAELMYFYALTKVPVINAVLIAHIQPVFVILFGFFVFKEDKLTLFDYIGIAVMMAAGLLVTTKTPFNLAHFKLGTVGDLLVLFSTIAWATTGIAMRKYLVHVNSGVLTFYRYFMAAIVLFALLFFIGPLQPPNIYQITLGLVIGIGSIFYYEGLKRMQAALVGSVELSTPFFAAIIGFVTLGETITLMQGAGILLLMAGIVFMTRKPVQHAKI